MGTRLNRTHICMFCPRFCLSSTFPRPPSYTGQFPRVHKLPLYLLRSMLAERHMFRLPDSGLSVSANRYSSAEDVQSDTGVTLVFAHCSSAHKEQWEPTISRLFDLSAASNTLLPQWRIREAWSLDAQNHGDSAVINQHALAERRAVSIQEYASMLHFFVTSKFADGKHIIAVGHSASTSAWTIACANASIPCLRALIFVEPVMVVPPISDRDSRVMAGDTNVAGVLARSESWDSYTSLRRMLKKRYPWKIWDERVLEAYLKHGFVEAGAPATKRGTIMPKCLKTQEVGFYYADDHVLAGTLADKLCTRYPVHSIFGERPEMVSLQSRKLICDVDKGRVMASISVVPRCGHLAVQENPDGVAEAIFKIISSSSSGPLGKHSLAMAHL
ncbi:Alpha/beta hydrolase family-domain-containing protein [Ganoderma leucocontextum]|nr:Alpha/beta hydrolase family-domain-containing protein [Ganoderma leucocontextum]